MFRINCETVAALLKSLFPMKQRSCKSCCIPQIFVAELATESKEIILCEFYPWDTRVQKANTQSTSLTDDMPKIFCVSVSAVKGCLSADASQ